MTNIIDKIRVSGTDYTLSATSSGGSPTVELTQAEYDALVSAGTVSADTYYIITDAQAGDLTQYWTSAQTNSAINQAVSGKANSSDVYLKSETSGVTQLATAFENKQDTLASGFNIKTINNESILGGGNIDIQGGGGGGKAVEAGRGITVASGDSAYTVSFSLPISAGTRNGSILENRAYEATGDYAHAEGDYTHAKGTYSHAEGGVTYAIESASHAEGYGSSATSMYSHAEGDKTKTVGRASHTEGTNTIANNISEHASGQYNVSSSASTTFGDSGNTLFSVGNGTADNARHNAFEIRQNGDIYLTKDGQDVKLQDQLGGGGSITIDPTLDSGSTNPVENQALWDELRLGGAGLVETTIEWSGSESTNYPSGSTEIKLEFTSECDADISFNTENGGSLGNVLIQYHPQWSLVNVNTSNFQGASYEISGSTITISYPSVTNVAKLSTRIYDYATVKAIYNDPLIVLKDQVTGNTAAIKTKVDTTTFNSYASSVDSALGGKLNVSDYVIDSALNVASRNPVQNQALYSELRLSDGGEAETTIEWSGSESTNYPNGCTKIKVEGITSNSMNRINFFADGGSSLGYITVSNWGSISVDTSGFQGASYEISGSTVIISYPTVTTVTKLDVSDSTKYTYKAITSSTTPLKDQVVANTTALGGLKLVKLTQAQYDALATKDSNTLYVING